MNPYEKCPSYENENYLLRLVDEMDAPDLLLVYSDKNAVPFFNSDNCGGDDFYYTSLDRVKQAIKYWLWEYQRKGFVRWAVIDKKAQHTIGTIELFNRRADDYFNNCGLLRLDLRSDFEHAEKILDILSLITQPAFALFNCSIIATKVPPFASELEIAVKKLGFSASKEKLVGGHDKKIYTNYFVLQK